LPGNFRGEVSLPGDLRGEVCWVICDVSLPDDLRGEDGPASGREAGRCVSESGSLCPGGLGMWSAFRGTGVAREYEHAPRYARTLQGYLAHKKQRSPETFSTLYRGTSPIGIRAPL
jgi:hypothetical protein